MTHEQLEFMDACFELIFSLGSLGVVCFLVKVITKDIPKEE